jgi:hypothetical protein
VKVYERSVDDTVAIFARSLARLPEARIAGRLVIITPDDIRIRE